MGTPAGYFDPSVDSTVEMPAGPELALVPPVWPKALISQYANSPRIVALIESFSDAIDADGLSDLFFDSIWNIDTASEFGLEVWARIVNVRRTLYVPGGQTGNLFGFAEEGSDNVFGFNQWPFNTLNTLTPNYVLPVEDFRRLILVKAFSNISDVSIPSMNAALLQMFPGRGNVYVADEGAMHAAFVFLFQPTALELAILLQSGAFATPSGVKFSARVLRPGTTLGFAEEGSTVGTFADGIFNS